VPRSDTAPSTIEEVWFAPNSDLVISGTASPSEVPIKTESSVSFTVTNNGPTKAQDVELMIADPNGVGLVGSPKTTHTDCHPPPRPGAPAGPAATSSAATAGPSQAEAHCIQASAGRRPSRPRLHGLDNREERLDRERRRREADVRREHRRQAASRHAGAAICD